jgi:RNA polymerase sigma factor (sigma-70 family)
MTDEELARRAAKGDGEAFGELWQRHQEMFRGMISRQMHHDNDVDDIMQSAALNAWRGLKRFNQRAKITTWLHVIVRNEMLQLVRRRYRKREYPVIELPEVECDGLLPDQVAELRQKLEKAMQATKEIKGYWQMALVLYWEGYMAREIAAMVNLNLGATKSIVHRAKEEFADRIQKAGGI